MTVVSEKVKGELLSSQIMTHHMIGKVLQSRYQIVQSLGAGVFGQTYIAVDIEQPDYPKCVIKQLKATSNQPSYIEALRFRFMTESETLRRLECHNQIPHLIACFEENERFYLVQEFIEGHPLTVELPINQECGYLWGEKEVVQFLLDILGILEFIHSLGIIHCDIKPENLIRRALDGKLFLIDFGSMQPAEFTNTVLPIYQVPVTSLGYIPPEQFISQPKPNSDIYALGMIAIQALTGLSPLQLKTDYRTNEVLWRTEKTPVSDYLAAILTKMISYNFQERYQTASEVSQALKQMLLETEQIIDIEYSVSSVEKHRNYNRQSPLLTGIKFGLAANSLILGIGAYSLLSTSNTNSETETLHQATEEYQSGDIQKAIALAKSIPADSNIYPDAQASIQEWQQEWKIAAQKYENAEKAFKDGRWSDVIRSANSVPDILYWQSKADKLVNQAKTNIEQQSKDLLTKAYEQAALKEFTSALNYLRQIPKESSAGSIVQQKLTEYEEKQRIRAAYLLQKAYTKAEFRDFEAAVKLLEQIPKNTPVYTTAQTKLAEYNQKLRQASESFRAAFMTPTIKTSSTSSQFSNDPFTSSQISSSEINLAQNPQSRKQKTNNNKTTENTNSSFINGQSSTNLKDFRLESYMHEVNIENR